ncbi:MAG TPA: SusC/RagA family TonB-linked outer membrane protein, partial [bacterium]
REVGASIESFPANYLPVFNAGTLNPGVNGYQTESKLESMFGRLFYSYADRYLANFTVRRDGSSRFAKENRYGTFPSVSLGWRISSEPFFKNIPRADAISDMKLRFDWGKLGNQEIGDYRYIAGITSGSTFGGSGYNLNYPFGDVVRMGAAITSFPALGLKWEETKTMDFGFDLSLFRNQLTLTVDQYTKETKGILYPTPIPFSTGVDQGPLTNIATMKNSGWEFLVQFNRFGGDFNYQVNANLTTIKNRVTQLGTESEAVWSGAMQWGQQQCTKTVKDGEVGAFWLYQTAGIFQSQQEIDNYVVNGKKVQPQAAPGDIKFVDQDGDGVLDSKDKIKMGKPIPDFEYGLNFSASYRHFDLSLSLHGVQGKKMFNGTKWFMQQMTGTYNWDKETTKAWTPTNTNTDVPRAILSDPNLNARESDRWLENASYLRVSDVQLGYTIPQTVGLGFGAGSIRIYVSVENALTITKYTGFDPTVTGQDLFERGVDRGTYPTVRTFRTGVELNFR